MATARPFAYNPGTAIPGTEQLGNLSIGIPTSGFTETPQYWNGPDEDLGYIIAKPISGNTQPTPLIGITASVGFGRSPLKTEESFVEYTNSIFGQSFTTGSQAKTWLNDNGYWTSYDLINPTPSPTSTPTPSNTPTQTPTPSPTSSCTNTIFTHGAVRPTCSDFCTTNYLIGTTDCATETYFNLSIGDFIYGYSGQSGYLAYSNVSTDTNTGPFRIADIDGTGEILGIYVCSGGSCIPL